MRSAICGFFAQTATMTGTVIAAHYTGLLVHEAGSNVIDKAQNLTLFFANSSLDNSSTPSHISPTPNNSK